MPPRTTGAAVKATAARFGLKVPKQFKDPVGFARDILPFEFGVAPGQLPAQQIVPMSAAADKFGRPLLVAPGAETRVRCPPGYLRVTLPDGSPACALAGPAIAAGLAKRRKKPLISVKETRALQMATSAQKKIDRVHKRFGTKAPVRRRRSK